ncbi:MAG TPA: hypothetical protein VG674_17085, partial [Amycolatopsis sp.]|nr:hypothetical protein [Amycolatopsis sp.]
MVPLLFSASAEAHDDAAAAASRAAWSPRRRSRRNHSTLVISATLNAPPCGWAGSSDPRNTLFQGVAGIVVFAELRVRFFEALDRENGSISGAARAV